MENAANLSDLITQIGRLADELKRYNDLISKKVPRDSNGLNKESAVLEALKAVFKSKETATATDAWTYLHDNKLPLHRTTVSTIVSRLCRDGMIEQVEAGSGRRSAVYRMKQPNLNTTKTKGPQ